MVRKREDGCWEGRIVIGRKANGDSSFRYIYADTQKELTAKIAGGHKADDHEEQGYIGPAP